MTRQHFEAIAYALRVTRPTHDDYTRTSPDGQNSTHNGIAYRAALETWGRTRRAIADECARFNPNFDRDRFYTATDR